MRGTGIVFPAWASAVSAASAEGSLSLWLKSAGHAQDETNGVVVRSGDGGLALRVQRPMNSFPARPRPIPDPAAASAASDAVRARVRDGSIVMVEMTPALPRGGTDGMELWPVADGRETVARVAGLAVPPEVLALFDPLGEGACTRIARR
jgi:hypothetical protein